MEPVTNQPMGFIPMGFIPMGFIPLVVPYNPGNQKFKCLIMCCHDYYFDSD